jgi:hypothetical protein
MLDGREKEVVRTRCPAGIVGMKGKGKRAIEDVGERLKGGGWGGKVE